MAARKSLTLFYYGTDGALAKRLATRHRMAGATAQVRDAALFARLEDAEDATKVVVSPTVPPYQLEVLRKHYGDLVESPGDFDALPETQHASPDEQPTIEETNHGPALPAFDAMTNREIRDWAAEHQVDLRGVMNKQQLIARIMAHSGF